MWNRIGNLMSPKKEIIARRQVITHPPQLELGIFVEEVTCSNFEEGYAQKNS